MTRIGVFGWGVVAPKSPDIEAFARNLASARTWLEPFNGFGPDTFLVGVPQFDFRRYQGWVAARFPPPLAAADLHPEIARVHNLFVFDRAAAAPPGLAGKLSMGIGGINACVLSRAWK